MTDGGLYEKLAILNSVYNNTLSYSTTSRVQSSTLKTQLYPHQVTMVEGMHGYRDKMMRGFLVGNQAINGKIGIIGDAAGTGKTLSILAYLASYCQARPRITTELSTHSSKYFFSHELVNLSDTAPSTHLIIVPHSLFNQWRREIDTHTTMVYVPIETRRVLRSTDLLQRISRSAFVLTTNKCYTAVQEYAEPHGIQWNNIIVDEATSIYMKASDPKMRFQFLWFVTNNWIPLLFKTPSIVKSNICNIRNRIQPLHPDLEEWLLDHTQLHYEGTLVSSAYFRDYLPFFHPNRGTIVLRNSNDTLRLSINLPQITTEIVHCRSTVSLNSLRSYYVARNTDPTVTSAQVIKLFQGLGIEILKTDDYINRQVSSKHELIQRRLEENDCVICLEHIEHPTIVNCCYNIYCGKCLLKSILIAQRCPTCRTGLELNNIHCLRTAMNADETALVFRNKAETFFDILRQNRDGGKFIVYSSFDNVYYQLFEETDRIGLKSERLESNVFSMLKTIQSYQEGKIDIIFVSNVDLVRGLSFAATSHLIFYHEPSSYEQKQILIHSAQRIGRKQPLKTIHLDSVIQV